MSDSTIAGLKGVMTRLLAYSDLTDIVSTRIYSNVPQQTTFPYVAVDFTSVDWSQQDDANLQHVVSVNGYSRTSSPTQALQIAQEVYNSLNRQENNITLDAGTVVLLQFAGVKTTFKEIDGVTWHSVIEFNFIID